jgi:hypothetical protein
MHFCLIGATHPCHKPRPVREADSLAAAGHTVRVVASSVTPYLELRDAELGSRQWGLGQVRLTAATSSSRGCGVRARIRRHAAKLLNLWPMPQLPVTDGRVPTKAVFHVIH